MEANADKIGLGDDIYLATDHSNGVLRLVSTDETIREKALKSGEGVLINGTVWAKNNVGVIGEKREFTYTEAQNACPQGWRLPTEQEVEDLIKNGKVQFGNMEKKYNELYFPVTKSKSKDNDGLYNDTRYTIECLYWINTPLIPNSAQVR